MPTPELQEFFAKIQGGDEGAVKAILEELDPFLRRVIRMRLLDGRLRHAVDTTDILQSLLKDFLHNPPPASPPKRARRSYAPTSLPPCATRSRRDCARSAAMRAVFPRNGNPRVPSRMSANAPEDQDFAAAIRSRLGESTRLLFDLKAQGLTWQEVAAQVGGRADALRMRLNRAVAAVLTELGDEG